MLPQQNLQHDEEEIPIDDNDSDVTKVSSTGPYGKGVHIRERVRGTCRIGLIIPEGQCGREDGS